MPTPLSGFTIANLTADVLYGEGVVFVGSTRLGVTKGPPKWTPNRSFDNIGFDGKHAPIKGLDRMQHGEPSLSFSMLEIGPAATGNQIAKFEPGAGIGGLGAPLTPTLTGIVTGGTLAAATYYVRVTAVVAGTEGPASPEVSVTTTGSTSSLSVSVPTVAGATAYRMYVGTTSLAQTGYFAVGSGALPGVITTLSGVTAATPPASAGTVYYPMASGALVASGSYASDVRVMWERSAIGSGLYFAVHFPVGLFQKYGIAGQDKKEAMIDVEIVGRLDMTVNSLTDAAYNTEYRVSLP